MIGVLGFRGSTSEKPPWRIFPDMDEQARVKPQAYSNFYSDKREDRPAIEGTIAMIPEHLEIYAKYDVFEEDDFLSTGKVGLAGNKKYGDGFPMPVTNELMKLGQEKYQIFCSRCHSMVGDGNGITKKFGMIVTPSYFDPNDPRKPSIMDMPNGQIFETITKGKGLMGPYGAVLRYEERWAVIAYVRALQRARTATIDDVPEQYRKELN